MKSLALTKEARERFKKQGLLGDPDPVGRKKKPAKARVYHTNETMDRMVAMAKSGYTGTEIAKTLNRHQATICCNLKRRGRYAYLTWEELEWLAVQRKREAGEEA